MLYVSNTCIESVHIPRREIKRGPGKQITHTPHTRDVSSRDIRLEQNGVVNMRVVSVTDDTSHSEIAALKERAFAYKSVMFVTNDTFHPEMSAGNDRRFERFGKSVNVSSKHKSPITEQPSEAYSCHQSNQTHLLSKGVIQSLRE